MPIPWLKISHTYTCFGAVGAGAYLYLLIPKREASNVSEALDRAGFTGIEQASVSDMRLLVAAYKRAQEKEKEEFNEKIEEVDINASDEEIAKQIRGGCRRLTLGGSMSSKVKDTARRYCVVPVTIEKTLSDKGYKFLDFSESNKDNAKWKVNAQKLLNSGNAPESFKALAGNEDGLIGAIKESCRDLSGAPTTARLYNKFMDVAMNYCAEK